MEKDPLEEKIIGSMKQYKEATPSRELLFKIVNSLPETNNVTEDEVHRYFSRGVQTENKDNGRSESLSNSILFKFNNMYKYVIPTVIVVAVVVGYGLMSKNDNSTKFSTTTSSLAIEDIDREINEVDSMNSDNLGYLDAELALFDVDAELKSSEF